MKLPEDTTLALEERLQDSSAVPRSMPASFYADPDMYPAEVECVFSNGWIFVNLDGKADDLLVEIEGLDGYTRNYHAEEMRTIGVETEHWDVNWKCLAENFMEGYHLTPVHRTTLHPMTPSRLCEKIPGGKGYTGYKSHYSASFRGFLAPPDYEGTVWDFYSYLAGKML